MLVVLAFLTCSLQASPYDVVEKVHYQDIALLEQSLLMQQNKVDNLKIQRNSLIIATLLAIAALFLLVYFQKKQIRCLIERAIASEKLLKKNAQLLADISDEIKTPLTSVLRKELLEENGGSNSASSEVNEGYRLLEKALLKGEISSPNKSDNESIQTVSFVNSEGNSEVNLFTGMNEKDRIFVHELKCFIGQNFQEMELNAHMAYTKLAMSERQFHRKMRALLEQSFSDYVREFRLRKGAQMLYSGVTVTQTAYDCGFTSQSYFSACFKAQYGMSPKKYQKQGALQVC